MKVNTFNENDSQNINNIVISDLVSELFNHINSKKSFSYISDLLIASLSEYKKKFQIEINANIKEEFHDKSNKNEILKSIYDLKNSETEYLSISNDIHSILSNCPDLSNSQKLDFCESQRYFMKLFLKKIIIQINQA